MGELALKRKEAPTVVETSKPYDSKTNGRAEGRYASWKAKSGR